GRRRDVQHGVERLIMRSLRVIADPVRLAAVVLCLASSVWALPARAADTQIPVPSVTIYPGQLIDQSMLTERVLRSQKGLRAGTVDSTEALVGKVARKTLLPGYPII